MLILTALSDEVVNNQLINRSRTIHKSIQEQPDDSCREASLENLKRLYTLDERAKARKKSMQEELERLEGIYSDTYKC